MNVINSAETLIQRLLPQDIASVMLRFGLATPFWFSGLTKWDGFGQLSETAVLLFTEEFKLNLFGKVFDFPFPTLSAYASSIGEIIFPIMLALGLFSRLAALALLAMTVVIQLTIWGGWPLHLTWAAMAVGVIALGPGKFSLDHLLSRRTSAY